MAIIWPVALLIAGNSAILSILAYHATARDLDWLYAPLIVGIGLLVLAGGFFLFNTVKVSNQVLGPLVRIRRVLEEHKQDRRQRIRLRKDDFLIELADDINRLLDWVEERERSQQAGAREQVEV